MNEPAATDYKKINTCVCVSYNIYKNEFLLFKYVYNHIAEIIRCL